ncbi:High affinity cGMP-specific 3',5'-cyclic phosphodiesterase 9A [Chionoecetes opilio]|uniref:Phosphodiesterase n=1 Tax=Chionoecetes opilio TaxID=41210 RepID=A0A8J4XQ87_CHIOP|nr:High affinity cGMP-specific 3',5'-cyclic phosphodiesterase 9A [Chionoecetes opilio]
MDLEKSVNPTSTLLNQCQPNQYPSQPVSTQPVPISTSVNPTSTHLNQCQPNQYPSQPVSTQPVPFSTNDLPISTSDRDNQYPSQPVTNSTSDHLSQYQLNQLCEVERSVASLRADLPPAVEELRHAVETFRMRLETTEHLSWLGFYKKGIGEPLGNLGNSHPYWKNVQYRRKAEEEVTTVCSKFREICDGVVGLDTQELLRLPSFNNWAWKDWEILFLLQHMYNDLGLLSKFGIETEVFRKFLCRVYHCYNQVPFHNFMHAFCVTQMMYGMICKCDLQRRLGDLDVLILLTSCVCHDLDHPGFNNIYQINARTELALRYNDISPLENHHCSVAFSVLERNECNIFKNVPAEDYKKVREGIIRCILATDMARHNEILSDFREIQEFSFENRAHVNVLFMVLIKVADISNEARPLDIAEPWLECLMQEFFNQSDLEKLEGLPVSPFMDREKVTKPSSQCSFIGFVLLPLFEALGTVLPELDVRHFDFLF